MKILTTIILSLILLFNSIISFSAEKKLSELPSGIINLDGGDAPALKLNDMDGKPYDIISSRGKWVFVHFWATWCGPCRREIPTIQDIITKFNDTNLDIVIINTAESEDTVFNFLGLLAPDIIPLMDDDGAVTERWQPRGLPATFFVDPNGKLRYLALGGRPWNKAEYLHFLNQFK